MGSMALDQYDAHAAPALRNPKTEVLAQIILQRARTPVRRLLAVGCGSGIETAVLARVLGADAVGIDVVTAFDPRAAAIVQLRRGDATRLEFESCSFDLTFSYHALEHIPDYATAIAEMHRVTSERGACCVGTPNRQRFVGYLGSAEARWTEKIAWNLVDWHARFRGRFRNELGAHAGFTSAELKAELGEKFGNVEDVTAAYYVGVYRRHAAAMQWLGRSGLGRYVFPSVYFVASK